MFNSTWLPKRMVDPVLRPQDFLLAELVVDQLLQDRAIQFQIDGGDTFDRASMQKHVNERGALLMTKTLLLDEVARLLDAG